MGPWEGWESLAGGARGAPRFHHHPSFLCLGEGAALRGGFVLMTCSYTDTGGWHGPSLPKLPSNLTIPQKLTSSTDTAAKDAEWEKLEALFTAQPVPRSLVYLLRVQGVIPILANGHANMRIKKVKLRGKMPKK